jgi:hypothetical protein
MNRNRVYEDVSGRCQIFPSRISMILIFLVSGLKQ